MVHRSAVMACAALVLATGGSLSAQTEKCPASGQHCHRLGACACKLGLSDQQKAAIRKIAAEFDKKTGPLEQEVWALRHAQREAMGKVLTEEQRGKVRNIIKAEWDKKWLATAAKLNLNDQQQQRIEKVRETYGKQFHALAAQKDNTCEQFRALRRRKNRAISRELSADQRTRFLGLVRAEKHERRNPEARRELWKGVGARLGVSAEQKEQLKKHHAEYAKKLERPAGQLKRLHQDQRAAMMNVLTEEQRGRLREMRRQQSDPNG